MAGENRFVQIAVPFQGSPFFWALDVSGGVWQGSAQYDKETKPTKIVWKKIPSEMH